MKIVIDIPEELYDRLIIKGKDISEEETSTILDIIADGTVLLKGHGRLIDADNLKGKFHIECYTECGVCPYHKDGNCGLIDVAVPTVIEADREV